MIVSKRIKEARLQKNMTQEELGNLIGVSKVSICSYEQGKKTPTLNNLKKIIKYLDIDPNYLFGQEVNIISDNDIKYSVKMSKEDINIINELKKHPTLYRKLLDNPNRTIELISRQIID